MRKTYEKPVLVRGEKLSTITAAAVASSSNLPNGSLVD